jgi:hypothetical protein
MVIAVTTGDGTEGKAEAQYDCYNFTYWEIISSPMTACKNKWPLDWTSFWFHHKVTLDKATPSSLTKFRTWARLLEWMSRVRRIDFLSNLPLQLITPFGFNST